MRSATELLAEMLAIYEDPEKPRGDLFVWLHHTKAEIWEVVERGEEVEEENATLSRDLRTKLGNQIGPTIFKVRALLCSSCSGKGTGLVCSECCADGERGEGIEPEPCSCVDPDCPLVHRNSYTNPSQEQLMGWREDGARMDWLAHRFSRIRIVWEQWRQASFKDDLRAAIDRARGEGE